MFSAKTTSHEFRLNITQGMVQLKINVVYPSFNASRLHNFIWFHEDCIVAPFMLH